VAFDQPLLVVGPLELPQGLDRLRGGVESMNPKEVLLPCPDKSFGAAVGPRLAGESRRAGHAEERQLVLEVATQVDTAVVVADRQPRGDPPGEDAEVSADPLADRLQRLEAVTRLRRMDADTFRRTSIDFSRQARSLEVRLPWWRSLAQTLRSSSPWDGDCKGAATSPWRRSRRAGFADQSQFSRHSKRLVGVTSGQFRAPARIA
jgi:hypothetical protein